MDLPSADVAFHEGERAVQERAGVADAARRLAGMLGPPDLRGRFERFLADRTYAALAAQGAGARLWVSSLSGPPGFLEAAGPTTLVIHGRPLAGDPLHDVTVGLPVGLIAIEFATRRRVRVNGRLAAAHDGHLVVEVDQAYGNCPKYIHERELRPLGAGPDAGIRSGTALAPDDAVLVGSTDTFFVGSRHPQRGVDCSHRGGPPGFVRVEDATHLSWPDFPGNNMFNTFGNLTVDHTAALLVPDFATGSTVQLTGTARVVWAEPGSADDDGHTGRRVAYVIERSVSGHLLPVHSDR